MPLTEIAIVACGAGLLLNAGLTLLLLSWFKRGEDAASAFLEPEVEEGHRYGPSAECPRCQETSHE